MIRCVKYRLRHVFMALWLLTFGFCLTAHAQTDRAALVRRGVNALYNLDIEQAREYLTEAVDPTMDAPDSIWAVGIQFLVQLHLEVGNTELANSWMRWAVRLDPDMQIDMAQATPAVIESWQNAVDVVRGGTPGDSLVETTWEWPGLGSRETSGRLRIPQHDLLSPITVMVENQGTVVAGESIELPPGSHRIRVEADRYESVEVTREILPGVTSVMAFRLEPLGAGEISGDVLSVVAETGAREQLVRFRVSRFGSAQTCGTGFFVGAGLVVTTYSALRGAENLDIELADGTRLSQAVSVAAWDVGRDVAVLRLPVAREDSLRLQFEVADGQQTWGLAHPSCGSATIATVRISRWSNRPNGRLELADALPQADQGGPLIDSYGNVLGIGADAHSVVPADHLRSTIDEARRNVDDDALHAVREVAERENHLYGSVVIQSTIVGASAQITPDEDWHWPGLSTSGPVPLTFSGPQGKYKLELTAVGQPNQSAGFEIEPGFEKLLADPQIVAQGGGFPWPIALLGAAGAAVAGYLVFGSSDDPGPTSDPNPTTIRVILPHHR